MLTENEITRFIQEDKTSTKKRFARVGQDYYEGIHDILNYQLYYYNADGQLTEDKTRTNIKISHPFFTELVDQEAQYMLSGNDSFIRSDNPELQTKLDEYFNENEDFSTELYDLLTGCIAKGFDYMYAYTNKEGKIAFQCADSLGVVEVRAKDTQDNCDYVIYWYIDRIAKDNQVIKKIQVWDKSQTYFYVQKADGKMELDDSYEINPRPHILYKKEGKEQIYYDGFGFIPFFRLDNGNKQFSGLKPIKALIDDYDLMSCGLSNNLQDISEGIYVVSGFQGDNLDELITNVKTKKMIGVDNGGSLDIKTIDIPYEARKTKLELDEKNIYRFGFGLDISGLKDTSATTNIAIKSAYSLLDLKCNKLELRLKQFLRKIIKVVIDQINSEEGTDYQQKDVYFKFEREVPINAQENAQIELTEAQTQQTMINSLLNVQSVLDNETLVQQICDILDLDYDDLKDKLPVDETAATNETSNVVNNIIPEGLS